MERWVWNGSTARAALLPNITTPRPTQPMPRTTCLALMQALMRVLYQWAQEVADHLPSSRGDLDAHIHARRQGHPMLIDEHAIAGQPHMRHEYRTSLLVLCRIVGQFGYRTGQVSVVGVREGSDLDHHGLAHLHETDIAVLDSGLYQQGVAGHDLQQRLRRSHYAAQGMDGQLLYGASDRGREGHESLSSGGFGLLVLTGSEVLGILVQF